MIRGLLSVTTSRSHSQRRARCIFKHLQSSLNILSFSISSDMNSKGFSSSLSINSEIHSTPPKKSVSDVLRDGLRGQYQVGGWIKSARHHKKMSFLHLSDGLSSNTLQIVVPADIRGDLSKLKFGAAIVVTGEVADSPAKGQKEEMTVENVNHIGSIDHTTYPFAVNTKSYDADYTRAYLHLRSRQPEFTAMLRLRSKCKKMIHDYFHDRQFVQIDTPILTSNDCEGAGDTFIVNKRHGDKNYFGGDVVVNLSVSGQLHLEACNSGLSRVYTFGPTFRADNAVDRTHLAEFYMLEAEISFINGLEDVLNLMEDLVKHISLQILNSEAEDIHALQSGSTRFEELHISKTLERAFHRLTYTDAIQILNQNNATLNRMPTWGDDLLREHEHVILAEHDNTPVFITDWPKSLKPFYMELNDDGETVACVDLIVPGPGELFGGSVRETRHDVLKETLTSLQMLPAYQWYLDLRSYGPASHGGFGMGFERFLQFLFGVKQIRDTLPFPRYANSCRL